MNLMNGHIIKLFSIFKSFNILNAYCVASFENYVVSFRCERSIFIACLFISSYSFILP